MVNDLDLTMKLFNETMIVDYQSIRNSGSFLKFCTNRKTKLADKNECLTELLRDLQNDRVNQAMFYRNGLVVGLAYGYCYSFENFMHVTVCLKSA